jgi:hypothetical protein
MDRLFERPAGTGLHGNYRTVIAAKQRLIDVLTRTLTRQLAAFSPCLHGNGAKVCGTELDKEQGRRPTSAPFNQFISRRCPMPITVIQGAAINNRFATPLTQRQRSDAQAAIAQLQYADLFRGAGTLHTSGTMRVDMQGVIAGNPQRSNIQVQINGINGASTVAHADFARNLATTNAQNQVGAANKVISALNQSLDTGRTYAVAGTNP